MGSKIIEGREREGRDGGREGGRSWEERQGGGRVRKEGERGQGR